MKLRWRQAVYGYGFVGLWLVGFALFSLWPLVETLRYSLHAVTVTATGIALEFVGAANYARALAADPRFIELVISYTLETLVAVPVVLVFAITIALFLNLPLAGRGAFRTLFFLPVVITSGPVMRELVAQGATRLPGLAADPAWLAQLPGALQGAIAYLLEAFVLILWFSGVQILIYLASLQKIDRGLYEAAAIDGASAWEAFWKITLPALAAPTVVNAIYTIVTLSHFAENPVVRYIYERTYALQGGIGYASALAFVYFGVMALLLLLVALTLARWAQRGV